MRSLSTTFRYTLTRLRAQILGWGIGLALYGLMIVPFYRIFGAQQERFQQMIASYPPEFLAFFGADTASMLTPAGFLKMYAFSMLPLIIGIFAVVAGSGLFASDEEHGRLDLILAHPVGRTPFFLGRCLALGVAALLSALLGWLGFCILLHGSSLGISWGQMSLPFLSLLIQLLVYATLALLLSMLLPSRNLAAAFAGALLVVSYFLSSLAFLDARLEAVARILPHSYFQPVLSLQDLHLTWLAGLLGVCLVMTVLAWLRFVRRDVRLSGEGSWQAPLLRRRKPA